MTRYAAQTEVTSDRSRNEIETTLLSEVRRSDGIAEKDRRRRGIPGMF